MQLFLCDDGLNMVLYVVNYDILRLVFEFDVGWYRVLTVTLNIFHALNFNILLRVNRFMNDGCEWNKDQELLKQKNDSTYGSTDLCSPLSCHREASDWDRWTSNVHVHEILWGLRQWWVVSWVVQRRYTRLLTVTLVKLLSTLPSRLVTPTKGATYPGIAYQHIYNTESNLDIRSRQVTVRFFRFYYHKRVNLPPEDNRA